MKPRTSLSVSLLALLGLLCQATALATDLAEKPLKAAALAKPNVIFGLDDSGSMDFEVMQYTNDGALWWDATNANGWNGSGVLNFNGAGTSSSQWRKFAYLFPNGSGSGNRNLTDSTNDHFAIPPTWQFAFLRSSKFNPLYYNPAVTYAPWAKGYVSGSLITYNDAVTTGVKSHPVAGGTLFDLTTNRTIAQGKSANHNFMVVKGMWVPAGSQTCDHAGGCGSWTTEASDRYVPAGKTLRLAMDYYPATYYQPEDCGAVNNTTCVAAPDGTKLKRYEIKSGNTFPSGRTYAAELQNFANWFQYSRKRVLMLSSSMGEVLESMTDLKLGVVRFNANATVTMYDLESASASTNGRKVAGLFYETTANGGTPTRETLKYIGEQYRNNAGVITYACQRQNAFVMTDGFAYANAVAAPGYSPATWGTGAPYQTTHSPSLADLALAYYTINLKPAMAQGLVPKTETDLNPNLHMNTYAMTLGARGTIYNGDGSTPPAGGAWPNPDTDRNPTSVDDLWHATINGRGKMFTASTREGTADAILSALLDMSSQTGAQSAVAVSAVNMDDGDGKAYLASYDPAGWAGNLTANPIAAGTGTISDTPIWSASALLAARNWTTRVVFTSANGVTGVPFTAANIGATVNPSPATFADAAVVDYLRGKRDGEGPVFRKRLSLLGAVINAEPVVDAGTGVVYLASGEGMLHAFNTADGAEQWAFVPTAGLTSIGKTVVRGYSFKTKLDATPVLGQPAAGSKLLVGGMGAAGRSFYALDVTNPKSHTDASAAGQLKWTFPGPSHGAQASYVGYSVGRPAIVKSPANGAVVLLTSGYDNGETIGDGKGRMWMLDPASGSVIATFTTTEGSLGVNAEAGLAQIKGYREDDGTVRFVYGGDLLGNLWKFDLVAGTTTRLAILKDALGNRQPVTTAPQLTRISGKPVVMVGTGRLLDIGDFGSSRVNSVYAISDGPELSNARTATTALALGGDGHITGTVNWAGSRGWYVDLPAGEAVNVDPKYVLGRLFVNTNVAGGSNCAQSSFGYVIDVLSGAGTYETLSSVANATSPLLLQAENKLYRETHFNDGTVGKKDVTPVNLITPRKNSWRDIVR